MFAFDWFVFLACGTLVVVLKGFIVGASGNDFVSIFVKVTTGLDVVEINLVSSNLLF